MNKYGQKKKSQRLFINKNLRTQSIKIIHFKLTRKIFQNILNINAEWFSVFPQNQKKNFLLGLIFLLILSWHFVKGNEGRKNSNENSTMKRYFKTILISVSVCLCVCVCVCVCVCSKLISLCLTLISIKKATPTKSFQGL